MSAKYAYAPLAGEYATRWARMQINRGQHLVHGAAKKILSYKDRYVAVSKQTGVPWYFIGLAHYRESNCNFHGHLHNGDPLSRRTRQVPANRPVNGSPPFTWEESALDALHYKGLHRVEAWPIERVAYELERYNGFGYRQYRGIPSPYLWSYSSEYVSGKYVADGKYDPNAVDQQIGVMPVLKALISLDPTIVKQTTLPKPAPAPETKPAPSSEGAIGRLIGWLLKALVSWLTKKK